MSALSLGCVIVSDFENQASSAVTIANWRSADLPVLGHVGAKPARSMLDCDLADVALSVEDAPAKRQAP